MSSAEAASQNLNNTPSLTGGIPTRSADLGPSIVFLVLFVGALGGLVWRMVDRRSRWWVLIRPIVFVILQIAGGIIRAIISTGHYASGWFIGDQICALVSPSPLSVSRARAHAKLAVRLHRRL